MFVNISENNGRVNQGIETGLSTTPQQFAKKTQLTSQQKGNI